MRAVFATRPERHRVLKDLLEDRSRGIQESGTYGVCVECGEEIPEARLRALPFRTPRSA